MNLFGTHPPIEGIIIRLERVKIQPKIFEIYVIENLRFIQVRIS